MHRKSNSHQLAVCQAAAARAQQRGSNLMTGEETAILLQQQQHPHANIGGGAAGELKLTRELMECLAMAQGMRDGLSGLGLDAPATYEYLSNSVYIRSYCTSIPIPFSSFDGIRSTRHDVKLTATQEESVMKSFDKLVRPDDSTGSSTKLLKEISVSLPFVSAFFDQRCPELRNGVLTNSRSGASYLLLSVITGHIDLCSRCLKAGANPNNMSFLRDESPPIHEMFHGYSPIFMAVLAEQLEILDLLSSVGGSIHVYDRWGRTPLHAAVAMNNKTLVQWLLAKGAPRYVGDCLNLIPAESAENYFPELGMPSVSLLGPPWKPPRVHLMEYPGYKAEGEERGTAKSSNDGDAEAAETSSRNGSSAGGAAGSPAQPQQDAKAEDVELCHCHSGRPQGYCGCVDDVYMRWSLDRLRATWSSGVDYCALAQRQNEAEQKKMNALNRRRK